MQPLTTSEGREGAQPSAAAKEGEDRGRVCVGNDGQERQEGQEGQEGQERQECVRQPRCRSHTT